MLCVTDCCQLENTYEEEQCDDFFLQVGQLCRNE